MSHQLIDRAAEAISNADALLIGAGAGMGVDSGLPDFRGKQGFWRAYPIAERLGLSFAQLASPDWFQRDPSFAWGFYGHRRNLYRQTEPHHGFTILRRWLDHLPKGGFVFTSNVDGHFQKAGFDPEIIVERHGTIERSQCLGACPGSFEADPAWIEVDLENLRAADPLPSCPGCQSLARPNVLMFGDWSWNDEFTEQQLRRFEQWARGVIGSRVVVIELGAGAAVPTVRHLSEEFNRQFKGTLIRINLRDPEVPPGQIGIPMSALVVLQAIDRRLVVIEPESQESPET